MKRQLSLITCILLLQTSLACAGDPGATVASPALTPPNLGGLETTFSIIKLLAAFLVVAGVMVLVFKLMGKFGPTSLGKSGLIEVLDTRMIAQKKYISVVRIAGQDMAVGISENNISLLCTLNGEQKEETPPDNREFTQALETAEQTEGAQP